MSESNSIEKVPLESSHIDDTRLVEIDASDEEKVDKLKWYQGITRLFLWYPSDLPKAEKLLLRKIDAVILAYVCTSYFTKSLDKSNITNAYVSGMKQDLNFGGNDLSYAKSLYSAGYIVSMCCGTLFVTRDWARLLLPILETIWGIMTFCQAAVKTPEQMLALRFLIGLAEGPIFPCVVYIIGSWYTRKEIYRRVMAFSISSSIGGMFSGFLQSAAYANLSGKGGLAGWKWGFIVDGIITVPVALLGFLMFPGTPSQVKPNFWISQDELKLAFKRMEFSGVEKPTKLSLGLVKRVFLSWHVHFFTAFWVLLNVIALPDGTGLPLWLDANSPERFSVEQVNNYPSIQSAFSIVFQIIIGGLSDTLPIYPLLTFIQCMFIISYSSLAAWNIPDGWRWVCFMIVGFDTCDQIIVSGWINRACRHDSEERAFVLGFSDAVSQAINIWTNIVFFPTDDAPKFHLGYIISTVGAILMLLMPVASYYGEKYDNKHHGKRVIQLDGVLAIDKNIEDTTTTETQQV